MRWAHLRAAALASIGAVVGTFGFEPTTAQAQSFGISVGLSQGIAPGGCYQTGGHGGGSGSSYGGGYGSNYGGGYGSQQVGYGSGYGRGYGSERVGYDGQPSVSVPGYNPSLPYSPAQQQGWRAGKAYHQTGIAPNRPLSPAETRGFIAGQVRQASTPWQLDPAKQQGWRDGQHFYETGHLPDRPLSPAERQGFQAAIDRRAASIDSQRPW